MKLVNYTGTEAVLHAVVGRIEPGVNQIHDDAVAAALLTAGASSGQFLPVEAQEADTKALEVEGEAVTTAEADATATPRRGRAKE